jgi:hypothetical protein
MDTLASRTLRPYQREIFKAIVESVLKSKGLTFSVEIARQGGKNEISAQIELLLLTLCTDKPWNLIKCAPTFNPQLQVSMVRLKELLDIAGFGGFWETQGSHIIRLGNARAIFLSADKSSRVVGNTAHILLEVDESQDVNKQKYSRDFRPMGSTTNVTTVHYGTTWDDATLLEEVKQNNLELERNDGIRRHFRYDWQEVAKFNHDYLTFVENERQRLGDNHPLFLTQYCLLPVSGGGGFLNSVQRAQLQGNHLRWQKPESGKIYVAGIDLAGEAETDDKGKILAVKPRQDATVVTIAELDYSNADTINKEPILKIVEHYWFQGIPHNQLYAKLISIIKDVWGCKKAVIDATGVGQPVAAFLRQPLGTRIVPFVFTTPSKSELGFSLLAAINCGRLKIYAADNSDEYREFWKELTDAKSVYRASRTMNFFVEPGRGHDDFLMSLALVLEAANVYQPKTARGS